MPGLVLPAVFSNWVSIHTSPTPGIAGFRLAGGRILGSWKYCWKKPSRVGSSDGVPSALYVRIGAAGYDGSHVTGAVALNVCQLDGTVAVKNVCTSRKMMSENVGTTVAPSYMLTIDCFPKSSPTVSGSSTTIAPSMYGWILQVKA